MMCSERPAMDFSRRLTPEILDTLPQDDPRALRSRRDLRMINAVLGGGRWLLKQIHTQLSADPKIRRVIECGAGDGILTRKIADMLAARHPDTSVIAVDLQPHPRGWQQHPNVQWHQGDLLTADALFDHTTLVVANLMLHHFTDKQLQSLGKTFSHARCALLSEPHRWKPWMRYALYPLGLNDVTRHDMKVSIESGFTDTELADTLGFAAPEWEVSSRSTFRGLHQVVARRISDDHDTPNTTI